MTTPNLSPLQVKVDFVNETISHDVHARAHNDVASAALQHRTAINQLSSIVTGLQGDVAARVYVDEMLLAAVLDPLIVGTITRDANGAATSAGVVWPDGNTGRYTATVLSAAHPGAVDAYTVTKIVSATVTQTFTQPAVTRDANGAVTNRPAMTVA